MKRILITGGAGFIGSNLAEKLLKDGYNVRVMDNLSTGNMNNVELLLGHPNYEFINGDIRNLDDCMAACKDVAAVSHQAALGSVPRSILFPTDTNNVNIGGFVNMLYAAKENGIRRFVYASSSSVYGDEPTLPKVESRIGKALSPYAVTKYTNEVYADVFAKCYGMEMIGFRYFNVFGPRQDPDGQYAAVIPLFIKSLLNNVGPYINGDGTQTRDFTYVDNAVQANCLGLFTNNTAALNEAYNIAVGQRFSIQHMYDDICRLLYKDISANYREPRAGDIKDSLADISKAQQLLGYQPTHQFEDGLPLTVEYFKQQFS